MVDDRSAARKGRAKKERTAGPRTRIGSARGPRVKDLVMVQDPRDAGQKFVAVVTGGYTLAGVWHVQLDKPAPSQRIPRQSTKASYIKQVWRRQT